MNKRNKLQRSDSCQSKRIYKSFNDAKGHIISIGGYSYKCIICGNWHVACKKKKPYDKEKE